MVRYVLTITELAKLKNITSETLRHYDRIDLLKPNYVSESGHRYYSIRQYEKLGTILELKKIGMSLKEIKNYFDNRNFDKSVFMLKNYQKRFEKKLNQQIQLNEILKSKISFLEKIQDLPQMESVFETDFPERYIITFGKKSGDLEEHAMAFTKLENHIHEQVPILASDRVGVLAEQNILIKNDQLVPAVPMMIVSPQYADKQYLQTVPAGKYVCMYYKNGTLEKYDKSFEIIKKYIYEHKYRITGPILQFYKLDVTLTNDRSETILEVQIAVK